MTKLVKVKKYIVKSNSLVEARYRLSLQESQIILWLLTQIRPDDKDFKLHTLEIVELAKLTGVTVDSRYSNLRKITKRVLTTLLRKCNIRKNTRLHKAFRTLF